MRVDPAKGGRAAAPDAVRPRVRPLARALAIALLLGSLALPAATAAPAPPAASAPGDTVAAAARSAAPDSLLLAETEFHLLAPDTAEVPLAHPYVAPGSLTATVAGLRWREGRDYRLRHREGIWIPLRPLGRAGGGPVAVVLRYRFVPAPLVPRLDLRPLATRATVAARGEGAPAAGAAAAGAAGGVTGGGRGDLVVRGSKAVRVSSGNRRDLTVDQTLRLNVSGSLTEDIEVEAALSDDNLPVVPEGNTEELRDIDRVRIDLRAPRWDATLGDFVARREGTVLGDYRRKLQGATLDVHPGAVGGQALAGSPRGRYRVAEVRGQEGNQGPYSLGAGVADDLFIVAGSERVVLDGEVLARGADRDYVIDYVRGTVTFTYRRLITAESIITVEFEQGEGPYVRTVVGGGAGAGFTLPVGEGLPGELTVRLTRERDDPQRLRTGELGDAERAALAAAGDDADVAVAGGVTERPAGEGSYVRRERDGVVVYVYDPEQGTYDLEFYFVGAGKGDYGVDSLTVAGTRVFGYRGEGGGSYLIGRPLPLPQGQSLVTVQAVVGDRARPLLALEWDGSWLDRNLASDRDDGDNQGGALVLALDSGDRELSLGGRGLGEASLRARHEARDARFRPFLLAKDLLAYETWGLGRQATAPDFAEQRDVETEVGARWRAVGERASLELDAERGRLEHGPSLEADRSAAAATWRWRGLDGASRWQEVQGSDPAAGLDLGRRDLRHEAGWRLGPLRPAAWVEEARWRDAGGASGADSVAAGFRLRRWGGDLATLPQVPWRLRLSLERGLADSLRADDWRRERDARTAGLLVGSPLFGGMRLLLDGKVRRIVRPGSQEQTSRLGKLDLSGAWPSFGSDWSLSYAVDNSRTEVLRRRVVFVGFGQGDYDEAGRYVGREQGEYDLIYAGTDSLVATTGVEADLSWRQEYGFLGRGTPWGAWSSLTHLAVRGRSRTDDVGRLLRLAPDALFRDEDAVLGEVLLRQEAFLLRNLRQLDLRLSFDYDQGRDRQFASSAEDRLRRAWSTTVTWSPGERTTLTGRAELGREDRRTEQGVAFGSRRTYEVASRHWELEWALRPQPGNRVALAGERTLRDDAVTGIGQREWALRPSLRYRLERRWSLQGQLRWAEVASDEPAGAFRPFFFAEPGTNLDASARLAWNPSGQLTFSLAYTGRRTGERGWQHDVRLESTARF